MNGLTNNFFKTQVPPMLTWMEDSRPVRFTPGVIFGVDSDAQVESTHVLHPNLKR